MKYTYKKPTARQNSSARKIILATLAIVVVAILAGCSSSKERPTYPKVTPVIENVDLSGTLHHLGGMLINDHQLIHVTHWPVKIGQPVKLIGRDGVSSRRLILSMEDLGKDLTILTLDAPVDLNNHTILPVAKPILGIPTTVFRFEDRPVRGTSVVGQDYAKRYKLNLSEATYLEGGDSGKIWVQVQEGKHVVVGLNSTTKGFGPPVYELLFDWVDNG